MGLAVNWLSATPNGGRLGGALLVRLPGSGATRMLPAGASQLPLGGGAGEGLGWDTGDGDGEGEGEGDGEGDTAGCGEGEDDLGLGLGLGLLPVALIAQLPLGSGPATSLLVPSQW